MLLDLVDKKDKEYFEGWWWQLTVGLTLDSDPLVRDPDPEDTYEFGSGMADAVFTKQGME